MNFAEEKSDFREKWRFEKNLFYNKSSKDTEDSEWEWKLFQILKVKQKILIMKKILRKDLADSFVHFIILFQSTEELATNNLTILALNLYARSIHPRFFTRKKHITWRQKILTSMKVSASKHVLLICDSNNYECWFIFVRKD